MTTNPDGKISEQSYDALNRLVARALTDVRRVVLIGRDRWDQEVGVTDPRGNTTTLAFDRLGRRVSETKPRGGVTSFTYDEVGNVRRITDPRQMSVESLYDDAGRKQYEKMWPSPEATTPSKTITYTYNDRGDLTGWDDGEMSGTFDIDPLGREAASSVDYGPFTKGSSTTYFRNGLQKTFTGPDDVTYGYAYDSGGRLRSIAIPGEGSIVYNDYLWSQPTHVTLPGGTVQEYEYDDFLRMTRAYSRDPAGNTIMDQHYQRDINGRVTRKETEEGYYQYGYDDSYQLISVESDIMPNESYEYDLAGNRYPTDPELKARWVYNEDDELLATDSATYEYDAAGNRVAEQIDEMSSRYEFDERGNMRSVERPAGAILAHYAYDPRGRRLAKTTGGANLYAVAGAAGIVALVDGFGDTAQTIGYEPGASPGSRPLWLTQDGLRLFFETDQLGAPVALVDRDGARVWWTAYLAFGDGASEHGWDRNSDLRLPGQMLDHETGLLQNWRRYYDPQIGRYLSRDPRSLLGLLDGQGYVGNSYAYVDSDPINQIDPSGEIAIKPTKIPKWSPDCQALFQLRNLCRSTGSRCNDMDGCADLLVKMTFKRFCISVTRSITAHCYEDDPHSDDHGKVIESAEGGLARCGEKWRMRGCDDCDLKPAPAGAGAWKLVIPFLPFFFLVPFVFAL